MKYEKMNIQNENSQEYAALYVYLIDHTPEIDIATRPMILICPGGGYAFTSDREAEMIALQFLAYGYHAAVLRYSVAPARYPTALLEVARSVACIRSHAKDWHVNPQEIVLTGFSAGGHLAANFCMFWHQNWIADRLGVTVPELQPNAMILGYPVITAGEYAHRGSFQCLLGEEYEQKQDSLSLENWVDDKTPRAFVWHTYEDGAVPVQNSIMLVDALVKHHIPVEFHMFEKGGHGLSLSNRLTKSAGGSENQPATAKWIELVHNWMEGWIAG